MYINFNIMENTFVSVKNSIYLGGIYHFFSIIYKIKIVKLKYINHNCLNKN